MCWQITLRPGWRARLCDSERLPSDMKTMDANGAGMVTMDDMFEENKQRN